ncbi:MAG TPA: hypothetical protein VGG48_20335 [Rhizomicrobium sp.]|jgi:hypothetical protein
MEYGRAKHPASDCWPDSSWQVEEPLKLWQREQANRPAGVLGEMGLYLAGMAALAVAAELLVPYL